MRKLIGWFALVGIALLWAYCQSPSGSGDAASRQTLSVTEEPGQIVLGWSGPVQAPMSELITAAFDRYKADQRRLVLMLNSPGGSIEHGRKVVAAIRSSVRGIDTLVQKAGVCASMCVPIFLAGSKRMADPEANFMFHQVSLNLNAKGDKKRQDFSEAEKVLFSQAKEAVESRATDEFFRSDIGLRGVSTAWLARMRQQISGHDVWISAQQLVDERSGIIDSLVHTTWP